MALIPNLLDDGPGERRAQAVDALVEAQMQKWFVPARFEFRVRAGAMLVIDGFRRLRNWEIAQDQYLRNIMPEGCYRKGPAWDTTSAHLSQERCGWYRCPVEGWTLDELLECAIVKTYVETGHNQVKCFSREVAEVIKTPERYSRVVEMLQAERALAALANPNHAQIGAQRGLAVLVGTRLRDEGLRTL